MISNETQEKLVERLINRIEQLNEYIIKTIGNRLKQIGTLNATQVHQITQILLYGEDINKIYKELEKVTGLNIKDIQEIFEEVAKSNVDFSKQFYLARGKEFIPYAENKLLQNQIKAISKITASEYVNLSRTMAFASLDASGNIVYNDLATTYQNLIDKAVISLTQGKETYQQVIRKSMKALTSEGITIVDYKTGYRRRLDSAMRMNILDSMRNMNNTLQQQFGEEFDADGVEISVHLNSAPDHIDVQGHQFSNEEFKNFQNGLRAVDYNGKVFMPEKDGKDRRPISELNCYHYIFSIVLGVSKPQYTKKELEEINKKNKQGFDFEGKHYTNYEGTQLQRRIETEVRRQKDMQIGAVAINDKETVSQAQKRITQLIRKYKELADASGLPTKMERMRVSGYRRKDINKM